MKIKEYLEKEKQKRIDELNSCKKRIDELDEMNEKAEVAEGKIETAEISEDKIIFTFKNSGTDGATGRPDKSPLRSSCSAGRS